MNHSIDRLDQLFAQQVMSPEAIPEVLYKLKGNSNYKKWCDEFTYMLTAFNPYIVSFLQTGLLNIPDINNADTFVTTRMLTTASRIADMAIRKSLDENTLDTYTAATNAFRGTNYYLRTKAGWDSLNEMYSSGTLRSYYDAMSKKPTPYTLTSSISTCTEVINHLVELDDLRMTNSVLYQSALFLDYCPAIADMVIDKYGDSTDVTVNQIKLYLTNKSATRKNKDNAINPLSSAFLSQSSTLNTSQKIQNGDAFTKVSAKNQRYNRETKYRCKLCDKDHKTINCPDIEKCREILQKTKSSAFFSNGNSKSRKCDNFVKSEPIWCLDSGCSAHMTDNRSCFTELLPCNTTVNGIGGKRLTAEGIGTVNINGTVFRDVLYVPDLQNNLISVRKIRSEGYDIVFKKDGTVWLHGKDVLRQVGIETKGGIYSWCGDSFAFCSLAADNLSFGPVSQKIAASSSSAPIWHAKLGHPSVKYYNAAARIFGKPILNSEKYPKCPTCQLSKGIHDKSTSSTTTYKQPLSVIMVDICGGFRYKEQTEARYFLTIVDAFSRYITVISLKRKSDATSSLITWITQIENFFAANGYNYRLGTIRSDHGGEFDNNNFHEYLQKKGVKHEFTVSHSSYQNGIAERTHRTIEERMRALMIGGKVPPYLWTEALQTSVYIINRTPRPFNNNKIPYCIWFNKSPKSINIEHLHVFGCAAYVTLPESNRDGKLMPNSILGVFVGYDSSHKAYRIYHIDSAKIFVAANRDIVFDDTMFPFAYSSDSSKAYNFADSKVTGPPKYPSIGSTQTNSSINPSMASKGTYLPPMTSMINNINTSSLSSDSDGDIILPDDKKTFDSLQNNKIANTTNSDLVPLATNSIIHRMPDDSPMPYIGHQPVESTQTGLDTILPPRQSCIAANPIKQLSVLPTNYETGEHTSKEKLASLDSLVPFSNSSSLPATESSESIPSPDFSKLLPDSQKLLTTSVQPLEVGEATAPFLGSSSVAPFFIPHGGNTPLTSQLLDLALPSTSISSSPSTSENSSSTVPSLNELPLLPASTGTTDSLVHTSPDVFDQTETNATEGYSSTAIKRSHTAAFPEHSNIALSAMAYFGTHDDKIPQNFSAALKGPNGKKWKSACQQELNSLVENHTFDLVSPPSDTKTIGSRWVFTIKDSGLYKARLVAQGFTQRAGIDYNETFAPVIRYSSVRLFLAVAASRGFLIHQMDVTTAFLNAPIDTPIYVRPPVGYPHAPGMVWKLNKSLYGLKQAPLLWNQTIAGKLAHIGFTKHPSEHGLFVCCNNSDETFVALYVDDLLIAGSSSANVSKVKHYLSECFQMKDLGPASKFLGMNITQSPQGISVSLSDYISKLLVEFGPPFKPIHTPLDKHADLFSSIEPPTSDITRFQSMVGKLLFASNTVRYDIAFAASFLSRFLKSPTNVHLKAARRVVDYLITTKDFSLTYKKGIPSHLTVYSDASYADDKTDMHSTCGYITVYSGAPITWSSKKIKVMCLSSTDAEYISMSEACKEAYWLTDIFNGLNIEIPSIDLMADNTSAIALAKHPTQHNRTKHINVKYHHIREAVETKKVNIQFLKTTEQPADMMTKPLSRALHERCRDTFITT
ncbi:uncharacterized protein SCDLUD_004673 [Saccharomycodes ludwigii]|uniref:uncharacterized protein n=1 Tax=Saccharomycodes ludwigii TaxID=36035 RepID=UPI001E8C2C74|nr:hypothetical protein SCDLUD_004673 [Saccharomycodes ludwigii]KAH3899240.1 hypothetical protein SCDLUD_004673 [Saccharomycodes ludwigii]